MSATCRAGSPTARFPRAARRRVPIGGYILVGNTPPILTRRVISRQARSWSSASSRSSAARSPSPREHQKQRTARPPRSERSGWRRTAATRRERRPRTARVRGARPPHAHPPRVCPSHGMGDGALGTRAPVSSRRLLGCSQHLFLSLSLSSVPRVPSLLLCATRRAV